LGIFALPLTREMARPDEKVKGLIIARKASQTAHPAASSGACSRRLPSFEI
jgi:hypothetical protein